MVELKINPKDEITIKQVMQLVTNWSKSTAQRRIDQCRDAIKSKKIAVVTVSEFIEYWEIKN